MPKGTIPDATAWVELQRRRAAADTMRGWRTHWATQIHESQPIFRNRPNTLEDPLHPNFTAHLFATTPDTSLYVLRDCRVLGKEGYVISPDNRVFEEFTYCQSDPGTDYDLFYRLRLPPASRLDGWWATIAYPDAAEFFHFEIECLPRLHLLEPVVSILDGLLVPFDLKPSHRELLERAGFDESRLAPLRHDSHLFVENLVVPSYLAGKNIPAWVPEYLQRRFLSRASAERQRIFISRDDARWRRIVNEEALNDLLASLGFRRHLISELTPAEQQVLFHSASIIVAPHGAALTNLVYCPADVKLLELFSPHHVDVTYWCLADVMGLEYWYALGRSSSRTRPKPDFEDIVVDLDKIRETLAAMGCEASEAPA